MALKDSENDQLNAAFIASILLQFLGLDSNAVCFINAG